MYIHVHSYTHHLKSFQERDGQNLKPPKDKKMLVQTTHIDCIHILQIGRIYTCMLYNYFGCSICEFCQSIQKNVMTKKKS